MRDASTDVYLVPYHSYYPDRRVYAASGRFASVEKAIASGEWPYDNGDDPSFFAARHDRGLLTWGVCRQDVRVKIREGSICVFVAFTKDGAIVRYRISAVATVAEKVDRRSIFEDSRFQGKTYINLLIKPDGNGWKYDEYDRHEDHRHIDWLWRISDHGKIKKDHFMARYLELSNSGWFLDSDIVIERDYVLFSQESDKTYISPDPPLVATARNGEHEQWTSSEFMNLTVGSAAQLHRGRRDFLRSSGHGYTHRQLRFKLPSDRAVEWRQSLISALRRSEASASSS
jgi:hypothetical protein